MKNEFSIKLESALAKLPQELKDTLALVIEDGKTYQETANILSIPIGTVRSRISRSRAQLKLLYDLYID
jgi:RNA polymerase sigma factor (sigma-70 family)